MIKLKMTIGGWINGIIIRNRFLSKLDSLMDICFKIFPNRPDRRYKSFIGNYFITKGKQVNIEKYTSQLAMGSNIVDIGCAEGSLLYRLQAHYKNYNFYGCDSGYASLYEIQNETFSNVKFHDLNIFHSYYSPDGLNKPEKVSLALPEQVDLVIMYDVMPYLDSKTQKNYLTQIGSSLKVGGELILTAMLETGSETTFKGKKGELYQSTTDLDVFLTLARGQNLILIDWAIGGWDKSARNRWDVGGADLLVLKKY
jgi:hypothetical protein